MAPKTGNTYISELRKVQLKFKRQILGLRPCIGGTYSWQVSTTATDNRKYRYGPQTGNNYISEILTDSVEILTPNSRFSMMSSSIKD